MSRLTLDPEHVIELWTRNGSHKIELWSGDITLLPLDQKVDIIMVSAFPGTVMAVVKNFFHILDDFSLVCFILLV